MGIFEGQAFSSFAAAAANARENLRVHGTLGEDPAPRDENGKVCGENPQKALVLSSGGVDSSTLLALAVKRFGAENVFALSISYGQRHEMEIESAKAVAAHYGVEQRFLDLSAIFADSDCSLLEHSSQDVPEESYAEQIDEADGIEPVKIDGRGLARRRTGAGQRFPGEEAVDQGGLADIGPPGENHLGQSGREKLAPVPHRGFKNRRFDFHPPSLRFGSLGHTNGRRIST